MNIRILLWFFVIMGVIIGCTPKVVPPSTEPQPTTQKPTIPIEEGLSSCPKFSDAPYPDQTLEDYVLYRDFLKVNDWATAFSYWKKVYAVAPAADGKRSTVFDDGIRFYEHFMTQTQDSNLINRYIDTVFMFYDEMERCYPEGMFASSRKAFDLYYKYPNRASKLEIYNLFKKTVDKEGVKTADFILNPFTALLVDLYFENQIGIPEAQKYQQIVRDALANGLAKCKDKECERWRIVEQYVPSRLEAFETVRGFYDCAYYKAKYYQDFLDNPTDCDATRDVYTWLRWGGCGEGDPEFTAVVNAGNINCKIESTGPATIASNCLQNNDYTCAIENFQKAANEEKDIIKKGKYLLLVSKIYYAHLKNFSRARQYALQAAEANPNWGEPYILIGRLYASSGPLCGPGRGWDSQIVVWPAIDMWNRAKRVDSNFAGEANKWIGRYAQYMPTVEDIFQRNLKEGDSFYVGCWIQESTTIRAAK
ncbi:MAG: hypothetical protein SFU99_07595 [Saprospiraceae bacterium]|nr:hypothetical protein [Saprospiraceae bacterium]